MLSKKHMLSLNLCFIDTHLCLKKYFHEPKRKKRNKEKKLELLEWYIGI